MKILLVGDIVGSPGRTVFAQVVARFREKGKLDFVVVNAENAAGGKGLNAKVAQQLFQAGADVITLGDHAWDQKEFVSQVEVEDRVVRPANFAPGTPGRGWISFDTSHGRVSVINLIGRVFMRPYDCPFRCVDTILSTSASSLGKIIIVDLHAEATSEKIVMGRYLDGRVSAVVGTHTHVQTSDEVLLPGGTAYITDLGMTGVKDSAIGRSTDTITTAFLTGMPARFDLAKGEPLLEGVLVDVDDKTGRARRITRIREAMSGPAKTALK